MKRLHKIILIYSIIFWLLVAMGCILTGFAFQKVPIGSYGLKVHYFSSAVDQTYYTNGLYHKAIGYNFVHFPRTKQFAIDQKITVTNKDLQKITLTYTLQYRQQFVTINQNRINPDGIYNMYNKLATNYQPYLISIVNNIISNVFTTLTQSQSRVSAQDMIITQYNSNGRTRVSEFFTNGIVVEGIWVNYMQFDTSQSYYESAYVYTASTSPSYQAAAYNLTMANLQLNAVSASIQTAKDAFIKSMQLQAQIQYDSLVSASLAAYQEKLSSISNTYNMSRVLNYYPHVSLNFN